MSGGLSKLAGGHSVPEMIVARAAEIIECRARELAGRRPLIVALGGPGGSGKSTLGAALEARLNGTAILPLDDYRKPRSERAPGIFGSHPHGNRLDLLQLHLDAAREGKSFDRPVFCRSRGFAAGVETLHPQRILIADGEISAHSAIRDWFDCHILVHTGLADQWRARIHRDRSTRQTSTSKAIALFVRSNLHDYPRFSKGSKRTAALFIQRRNARWWIEQILK